jgi:hypothetical protein
VERWRFTRIQYTTAVDDVPESHNPRRYHRYTGKLVHRYTGLLVHGCTGTLVHWYTDALVQHCTGTLLYCYIDALRATSKIKLTQNASAQYLVCGLVTSSKLVLK